MVRRSFFASAASAVAVVAVGSAVGAIISHGGTNRVASAQVTTTTTNIAGSAEWSAEGAQLIKDVLASAPDTGNRTYNNGDWAYESVPIDITGNGEYIVDFGPVPASFDYPLHPTGITFDWPSDGQFSVVVNSGVDRVISHGDIYVQMRFAVSRFSAPYTGYRAWIY